MRPVLPLDRFGAVIFDLDGVLTDTARLHFASWKETFDAYLGERSEREGTGFRPFGEEDYRLYVDGKPRYEGARSFLESRGIDIPFGDPADPPGDETACGLANRKNRIFQRHLHSRGPRRYESSVSLVERLREAGVRTGVISSSRNCRAVLRAAGIEELFEARVDGTDVARGVAGKPDPEMLLVAARRLGVSPERTAVVEDALSGVEAARRGGFGLVIGVDRSGHPEDLREAGADLVVRDLAELVLEEGGAPGPEEGGGPPEPEVDAKTSSKAADSSRGPERAAEPTPAEARPIGELPDALDRREEILRGFGSRRPAVFLDYDGTLTPIVEDPEEARLPETTRETLRRLAARFPVAVISGRDLRDVREKVALESLTYAGSHGFDMQGPKLRRQRGEQYLPALEAAEAELAERVAGIPGVSVERKRFAIAVHYRRAPAGREVEVAERVADVAATRPELRLTAGKKVHELRPDVEWDKGRALLWLLETLQLDGDDVLPVYIGDDVTDEDAFRALRSRGLGVVVRGEDDERPSLARYALEDPGAVRRFLEMLSEPGSEAREAP